MSFIRALEERRFSLPSEREKLLKKQGMIGAGLYVFPTEIEGENFIEFMPEKIPSEDFVEVVFRILEFAGVRFTLDDVNKVRKVLYLKPIRRIKTYEECSKAYW